MFKFLFIVIVSTSAGYYLGFQDAQKYTENVFVRTVHKIGGDSRGRVGADADRQMDSLEKR
jgi:hypothetical protein